MTPLARLPCCPPGCSSFLLLVVAPLSLGACGAKTDAKSASADAAVQASCAASDAPDCSDCNAEPVAVCIAGGWVCPPLPSPSPCDAAAPVADGGLTAPQPLPPVGTRCGLGYCLSTMACIVGALGGDAGGCVALPAGCSTSDPCTCEPLLQAQQATCTKGLQASCDQDREGEIELGCCCPGSPLP